MSACGPMLVPAEAAGTNTPNLLVGSGKSGNLYLLNMTNLGGYNTNGNNNQIVQYVAWADGGDLEFAGVFQSS